MDMQTLLKKHSEGGFESYFEGWRLNPSAMNACVVHTDQIRTAKGACHASVNTQIIRDKALAVITMGDNTLTENAGAIQYYDWLLNKSFFSDVFLCKDPVLSLKYGFVKRVDISAAKWLGAAQLSRLSTSEFQTNLKAVYDILASGFDIHPMLLTVIATDLNFASDGKFIFARKPAFLKQVTSYWYSSNNAHLPFCYLDTKDKLKEMCKDDPTKEFTWIGNHERLFNQGSWPYKSNSILAKGAGEQSIVDTSKEYQELSEMLNSSPSILFNAKLEDAGDYKVLWPEAVLSMVAALRINQGKGTPVSLTPLENLSKTLKLGK
jgi:hypothetical protein